MQAQSGAQLGRSWRSGSLPFSAKEWKCPFYCALFISKRPFSLDSKGMVPKIFRGFTPAPHFLFLPLERDRNEDHWASEVIISVNFPQYFLHLWICKTVFKGRIFFKKCCCALLRGLDHRPRKFLVVPLILKARMGNQIYKGKTEVKDPWDRCDWGVT